MTRRTRRKRFGTRRIEALQRVRDRALQRREARRSGGRVRRPGPAAGRRAERARPWLQFLVDLTTLLARLVR